ncbi:SusC/RagA family TonB-linked outer membrane protein [Lutibacter sp. A64]|uniref:SusC/RagA family TonB-linked outer membrane protein n=1 Tax=Lutibacter sp. A64 TaxID=2918526 RepID=UPI001F05B89B|nr:SusC/RagA family TonB-linked outer membrane protein [Lutibacter sp. A64]UMB53620.1 SusC/RagA family TonB-linked outer membrane protein [Lutibacter sp. A64]
MKSFLFLFCTTVFGFSSGDILSQNAKVEIDTDKIITVDEVFKIIKSQTEYTFIYRSDLFKDYPKVAVKKGVIEANKLLEMSLSEGDFNFEFSKNNTIVIKEKTLPIIQQTINGKVTDENGEPLLGVTIIVKGAATGTVSNIDGIFSIKANIGDELILTYVGFIEKTIKIENFDPLTITLRELTNTLEEVVVTGYYSIPKERATGSFSNVTGEELQKITSLSVKDKIEGIVPGLLFEPNYASDQSPTTERSRGLVIRGASTLGDNSPLIVVDGFPVISSDGVDPWSTINPDDVESLTVLKDAAAASIWGAQAANGVIVIKTKAGNTSKKAKIDVSIEYIVQPKPDLFEIPFASSAESIDIYKSLFLDNNYYDNLLQSFFRDRYEFPEVIDVLVQMKAGEITDQTGNQLLSDLSKIDVRDEFSDLFYRMETNQKVNISFSKGDETNNLRASLMSLESNKYAVGDSNSQIIGNFNNTFKPVDWFNITFGMNFSMLKQDKNGVAIGELSNIPQMSRILDDNGDYLPMIKNDYDDSYYDVSTQKRRDLVEQYNLPYDWDWNLKRDIDNRDITDEKNDLRLNAKVSFIPLKGLNIDISYQYQRNNSLYSNYMNEETWYVRNAVNEFARTDGSFPIPAGGMLYERRSTSTSNDGRVQASYNRIFEDHSIKLLGGFEIRKDYYESLPYGFYGYDPQALTQITALNYQDDVNPRMTGDNEWRGTIPPIPTQPTTSIRLQGRDNRFVSYYGNGIYTYKNKYDFTGSIRLDKTNLYGRTPSYRNLPQWSLGLGWSLDKETFFNVDNVDRLRLRTSYGWNGHIDKSASPYINGTPWVDAVNQTQYAAVLTTPNPGLTWEKTKTYNIGADFSMFGQRLQGEIELYNKQSEDVLTDIAVNPTYGFYYDEATLNAGDISNKGVEFDISGLIIDKEIKWKSLLNFSYNKNEVQNVKSTSANIASRTSLSQFYPVAGQPVDFLAVAEWAGYSENGLPQVYLDGEITEISDISYSGVDVDKLFKFVGQRSPKTFGSWTNNISYKNFELSARFLYSFGNKFLKDSPPRNLLYNYTSYRTFHTFNTDLLVDRWQTGADNETASMYSLDTKVSNYLTTLTNDYIAQYNSQNVLDAGQIRLQSISLAYRIPSKILGGINNARIQFQAKNLGPIFLKNKEGIDPSFPKYSSSLYSAYYNVIRDRPEYSLSLQLNL